MEPPSQTFSPAVGEPPNQIHAQNRLPLFGRVRVLPIHLGFSRHSLGIVGGDNWALSARRSSRRFFLRRNIFRCGHLFPHSTIFPRPHPAFEQEPRLRAIRPTPMSEEKKSPFSFPEPPDWISMANFQNDPALPGFGEFSGTTEIRPEYIKIGTLKQEPFRKGKNAS